MLAVLYTFDVKSVSVWIGLSNGKMAIFSIDSFAFFGPFGNWFWVTITVNLEGKVVSFEGFLIIHIIGNGLS